MLSEPLPDDFSKILFYGNQASHSIFHCIEFHDCQGKSLGGEESQRNQKSGYIRASLTLLHYMTEN